MSRQTFGRQMRVATALLVTIAVVHTPSRVRAIAYPFCEGMETTGNWTFEAPWGSTTQQSHAGARSITDSPGSLYANNVNASAALAGISLGAAVQPMLSFWERCDLEANADFGCVDVSVDGGASWTSVYYVTGIQIAWRERRIDLSEFAGSSDLRVRFRLQTNASVQADGWYIDDVCVQETPTPSLGSSLSDDLEGAQTQTNWLSASWGLVDSDSNSPTHSFADSPNGGGAPSSYPVASGLTTAGTIDLSAASCPRLVFWHRYATWYNPLQVQVSTDAGHSWSTLASYSYSTAPWACLELDLTPYRSPNFRLRFESTNGLPNSDGWLVDDVRIVEGICRRVDACRLEAPESIQVGAGLVTPAISGLVFEGGVTEGTGQGAGIVAQLGYGPDGSNPSTWSAWASASYISDAGTSDRYASTLTIANEGHYDYAFRFRLAAETSWTYADLDGNDGDACNSYTASQAGDLLVTGVAEVELAPASLRFNFLSGSTVASQKVSITNHGTGALVFRVDESPGVVPIDGSLSTTTPRGAGWQHSLRQEVGSEVGSAPPDRLLLADVAWLSESPTSGTVSPGATTQVQVTFSGPLATPGHHTAYLVVTTNDADESPAVIPVTLGVMTDVQEQTIVPASFSLHLTGPNPFASKTTFQYGLPEACHVRMEIFDVTGKRVAMLRDADEAPGYKTLTWDASNLRAGIYFYQFRTTGFIRKGRLLILR